MRMKLGHMMSVSLNMNVWISEACLCADVEGVEGVEGVEASAQTQMCVLTSRLFLHLRGPSKPLEAPRSPLDPRHRYITL